MKPTRWVVPIAHTARVRRGERSQVVDPDHGPAEERLRAAGALPVLAEGRDLVLGTVVDEVGDFLAKMRLPRTTRGWGGSRRGIGD
jgi:hypothetical protein